MHCLTVLSLSLIFSLYLFFQFTLHEPRILLQDKKFLYTTWKNKAKMRQNHIKGNTVAFLLHRHYDSSWLRFLLPEVSEPQRLQVCAVAKNETKPTWSIVKKQYEQSYIPVIWKETRNTTATTQVSTHCMVHSTHNRSVPRKIIASELKCQA